MARILQVETMGRGSRTPVRRGRSRAVDGHAALRPIRPQGAGGL